MDSKPFKCNYVDCGLILEDPISLSCGNNLCKKHIDQLKIQFKCNFCHKMHTIPEEGYLVNQAIVDMIENYIRLDPIKNEIKKSFDILNKSIHDYENIDRDELISDYFGNLKEKVKLHSEDLIKEINERLCEITNELKDKERKCRSNQIKLENGDLTEIKYDFIPTLKLKLRIPNINLDQSQQMINEINKKNQKIQDQLKIYQNDLLLGETIEFKKSFKSTLVGKLVYYSNDKSLSINCGQLIKSFNQHTLLVKSIQVDEKNKKIISASDDKTINIWDLVTGECLKTLNDQKFLINCILIIPNNKFISASNDKTIKIWDSNSYECLKTLTSESSVYSFCVIPNNQIACGCFDGSIRIWNLDNTRKVKTYKAHNDWIPSLILADKTKLISCSGQKDKKIKILSIETFECIQVLEGHTNDIFFLELTLDGNLLSCSYDKTIKLWQMETGLELKSIKFDHPVCCVKILNGDLIAVALSNGEIIIYNVNKMHFVKSISFSSSSIYRLELLSNGNLLSGSGDGNIVLFKIFD